VEELLTNEIFPVDAPDTVGVNCTWSVSDCPAFRVRGNVAPETLKPEPVTVAAVMVTGIVPDESKLIGSETVVFNGTYPEKARVDALVTRVDTACSNFTWYDWELAPVLAVITAVWLVATEARFTVN
jgi:hypothetical protein